jgi:hypothetical protein
LCLPKSRQAEDQTGHDEPGNGGEVFHGAIGFYWPSNALPRANTKRLSRF